MKKHIANILTGSRILFSLPLAFLPLSSPWFYGFYLLCGFTDMIDGTVARKTGAASAFGARLDTAADLVFLLVCAIRLLPLVHLPLWLWIFTLLVALVKTANFAYVFLKKKKLLSVHSALNKAAGVALFLLPLSLPFIDPVCGVSVICALAAAAAAEEVCFVAKGQAVL